MRIKFLSYNGLETLKTGISSDIKLYNKPNPSSLLEKISDKDYIDSGIECSPFGLKISNDPSDDFDNVKKVYSSLKDVLSESKASDERLWAGLALRESHWNYINSRWKKGGWKASTVKDRMFFGQHPRTRNALARLYWIGRLTYDNENEDHWHYTKFVCGNQRYIEDMLGRNISDNLKLLKVCADACEEYEIEHQGKTIDSNTMRRLQKFMNILGATYVIDTMDEDYLKSKLLQEIDAELEK